MPIIKILHCADIHIGARESFLGEKAESRRFETLITFEKIVDLAVEKGVQLVALAGDILDSNSVESNFTDRIFKKIADAENIKFVFAAGNHDPLNFRSPFISENLPKNLYVLKTEDDCKTFEDIKTKVYGRSFESAFLKGEDGFSLSTDSDYVNLMVQHGELKSDLNSQYNSITKSFIEESGMDYIALGHIHKSTEIGKIGKTYFAYCGCSEGQGFDETDQKGVYVGEIGEGQCNLEFVPVSRRMHIVEKIDVSMLETSSEIADFIISSLADKYNNYSENLYKISLVGGIKPECEISVAEVLSRIADKLYFVKIKDETQIAYDYEALAKETSLKGIFVKKMLEKAELADEVNRQLINKALVLGLKAFESEVSCNED